jgi:RimJ/RimL family protein N-acetyltransferase
VLNFRKATLLDVQLFFEWANDPIVREQSYNSMKINFESHKEWFANILEDDSCMLLLFQNEKKLNIGQVRIQKQNKKEGQISVSIASEHRGNGFAKEILLLASDYFLEHSKGFYIRAFIKKENMISKYAFEKSGFKFEKMIDHKNCISFQYIKKSKK